MKEYVSFNIAKIAKEKGFNEPTLTSYTDNGELNSPFNMQEHELTELSYNVLYTDLLDSAFSYNSEMSSNYVCAPTYTQLIEWVFGYLKVCHSSCMFNPKQEAIWIEFWYNTLMFDIANILVDKDEHTIIEVLNKSALGILNEWVIDWFEEHRYHFHIEFWQDSYKGYIRGIDRDDPCLHYHHDRYNAFHEVILKCFEQIKNK